jgi:hemerythrin-like domain-containing protein
MSHTIDPVRQIELPGQTHVAEGPYDQTGMYLMHHAFRRDLDRFVSAVRNTPAGDVRVWKALAGRWSRFEEVLHHHHVVEDTSIWPALLAHADSAGAEADRATLEAMEAEHGEIDPALAATRSAFATMLEHPCADHRNALDVHLTALRQGLLEHLRHEETEALPLLQRTMTVEEWEAAERAAQEGYPTRLVPFLVPWVADGVPADVAHRVLADAGRVYGLVLRVFRPWFAARERAAFRYAG